jgi:uncharacterized membrane protein
MDHARLSITEHVLNNLFGLLFVEGRVLSYTKGREIKVIEAPEPSDINWSQLQEWVYNSTWKRFVGSIVGLILFTFLSGIVFYLAYR